MADERYEWLDRDAAERLLRGEPVGPVGEDARAQAERLAAALDGVARAGGHETGELPGEAAALAAFRKARATAQESPAAVRIERRASAPLRWGRPVRIGLAGALAGVALGGVAVAAGTGVLPSPFDRGTGPAPASSVSAAATPPPAAPGTTAADPDGTGGPTPDGTSPGTPGTPGDGNGGQDGDTGGTHTPSAGPDGVTPPAFPDWAGDGRPGTGDGSGDAPGSGDWYRATVEACRDHRSGSLAPHHERRLEEAAKGADRVERFCDRLLDASRDEDGGGTGSGDGGRNSGGHNGGRDGHDRDDDRDDRYDGGGEDGRGGDGRTTDGRRISPDGAQGRLPAVPYSGLPAATAGSDAPAETLTYPS
ncbi:hypothetical protein GCM10009730_29920 [Streptomyces albidochromogenes]|uniref:hypothetical protein n=1 Tax=Streptomyces albidochromogenes TaxID=329524 RepID=UPI002FE72F4C